MSSDGVDDLIAQWRRERPDLEFDAMATIGRMGRVMAAVTAAIEEVFAGHDLTIGDFDVLAALRRSGSPFTMRPTDLARALMLSPAGMTSRLDRLSASGLVDRTPDPDDRRSWIVGLTEQGRRRVDEAVADHVSNEEALLSGLSGRQRSDLDRALRTLLAGLEAGR